MRYLLVDRIDEVVVDAKAVGRKNVAMTEDYLEWHFPEQPVVPGTLILEAFVQLAGWLEAASSSFERWVLLDHVTSARYFGAAVPGDRIDLVLERVPSNDPARRAYRGESTVAGQRKASVEFEATVVAVETLDARDRMERAYRTLRGESPAAGPAKRKP